MLAMEYSIVKSQRAHGMIIATISKSVKRVIALVATHFTTWRATQCQLCDYNQSRLISFAFQCFSTYVSDIPRAPSRETHRGRCVRRRGASASSRDRR